MSQKKRSPKWKRPTLVIKGNRAEINCTYFWRYLTEILALGLPNGNGEESWAVLLIEVNYVFKDEVSLASLTNTAPDKKLIFHI